MPRTVITHITEICFQTTEDIISLMASFSARIYGKRSAKNRKGAKAVVVK